MSSVRPVNIAQLRAEFERRPDGSLLVTNPEPLGPYPGRMGAHFEHWSRAAPDRTMIAEREHGGAWRSLSYAEAMQQVRAIAQGLLARDLSAGRPVMILSDNSIAHLLVALACLHVGVPYSPVSPAYSLLATDFAKLRQCAALLTPGLVFAAEGARFAAAIEAVIPADAEVVITGHASISRNTTPLSELLATAPTAAVDAAAERVGPDHIAKILFTSGSTGVPKGVINTHRMLCSNQQMIRQSYPVLEEEPPVLLDWLPWSHTFGGNHDLGIVLANGGTFYIDDGRPVPGKFEATVRNLCDVSPTAFYSVPKAFEELGARMEHDAVLRERFFVRMKYLFYAGAGLPQQTWDTFERLAVETIGQRIQWMTGLGSTETAPFALSPRPDVVGAGIVGLPAPGVELKLAPVNGKMEARVRGPSITPGYWRMPEQTAKAFDEEGFYRMGDALVPVDANDLSLGFRFDGRVSEDFKLLTGTWVSVGPLRTHVLSHLAPHVKDVAIAGMNRDYVAVLAIPQNAAAADDPAVCAAVADRLETLVAQATGSSTRVMRLAWLTAPLSIDAGELTDKGSINQRAVLSNYGDLVEQLYAEPPPPHVICARVS